eukprot:gene16565-biopygen506
MKVFENPLWEINMVIYSVFDGYNLLPIPFRFVASPSTVIDWFHLVAPHLGTWVYVGLHRVPGNYWVTSGSGKPGSLGTLHACMDGALLCTFGFPKVTHVWNRVVPHLAWPQAVLVPPNDPVAPPPVSGHSLPTLSHSSLVLYYSINLSIYHPIPSPDTGTTPNSIHEKVKQHSKDSLCWSLLKDPCLLP